MDKAGRLIGKFHYGKNVWRYRYRLKYGGTGMPLIHMACAVTAAGLVMDSRARAQFARATAYNARKDRVSDALQAGWAEERKANTLNVAELEAAVYRARTSTNALDLREADGSRFQDHFVGPANAFKSATA
uniref:Uncharacterized protein n=1 Tax=Bicosoecida sp. CB-2014 TaxID=1486930 RepID=A0A7S1G3R8_9STRA